VTARRTASQKQPHDIPEIFRRIRAAVRAFPKAAMFELADDGFSTPFEQLVACIISIRTRDEVMVATARRLFAVARSPGQIAELEERELDAIIGAATFHEAKARQIVEIARTLVECHDGIVPCDYETLLSLKGVGPKCANLVLGIACGEKRIGVDIHVHRVTNRWGYVAEPTPEKTMRALERKLPRRYWVEINRLLVPFGKHVCTGARPKCRECPVVVYCEQVGVVATG
jgi:endonuclease-3